MRIKPKHQRLIFVTGSMIFLIIAALLTMQAFKQNLVYFYSPSDIAEAAPAAGQKVRIGGLVKEGSVIPDRAGGILFTITDGKSEMHVFYHGMLPNLFREGQGVIAEGVVVNKELQASSILAKHDENYMPKEVVDSLKKSGHWKDQYAR